MLSAERNNNITDLNPHILIIALNVDGLNSSIKGKSSIDKNKKTLCFLQVFHIVWKHKTVISKKRKRYLMQKLIIRNLTKLY